MKISVHANPASANAAAAARLAEWLLKEGVRHVMLAAGNTPLELYRLIGAQKYGIADHHVYALDEYVGVPSDEPRNCANLIRRSAVLPWGVCEDRYHFVSSTQADALASVRQHEKIIERSGGLDVVVLGLGQNGHLGFNEPGSTEDSTARVIDLEPSSVQANRQWFGGDYAPSRGATVGLKTILGAKRIMLLAYGAHKTEAVRAMLYGPRTPQCPASFLQGHPSVEIVLDETAADGSNKNP